MTSSEQIGFYALFHGSGFGDSSAFTFGCSAGMDARSNNFGGSMAIAEYREQCDDELLGLTDPRAHLEEEPSRGLLDCRKMTSSPTSYPFLRHWISRSEH